ncbi:MAG: transcription elongation factor 1 family protein [Candidatus Hodarchaeales archaeon]|jgi:transcription elongation factor Elf1
MGRKRRRKVQTRPRPTLPKVFECPECSETAVHIKIDKKTRTAEINCGACKLSAHRPKIKQIDEFVDVYGDWLDEVYS